MKHIYKSNDDRIIKSTRPKDFKNPYLSLEGVQWICKKYGKKLGIQLSPHSLRKLSDIDYSNL